eukprot:365228-Chlamydomonas_euryale.AAC.26
MYGDVWRCGPDHDTGANCGAGLQTFGHRLRACPDLSLPLQHPPSFISALLHAYAFHAFLMRVDVASVSFEST